MRAKLSNEFGITAGKVNFITRVELLMDKPFKIVHFTKKAECGGSIKTNDIVKVARHPNTYDAT